MASARQKEVGIFKQFKIWGARDISLVAVFSGLVFVLTMFAIPMPMGGYWHLGNVMIILIGLLFGPLVGGLCGPIGAATADLVLGYGMWAPFTLVIKFFVGMLPGLIFRPTLTDGKLNLKAGWLRLIPAVISGWLANLFLYAIAYAILLGVASVPGWFVADISTLYLTIGGPIILLIAIGKAFPKIFGYRESLKTRYEIFKKRAAAKT